MVSRKERPQCPHHCLRGRSPRGPPFLAAMDERTWLRYLEYSIGWLVLVLVAMLVVLAALSNGGPAMPYSDLRPFALLMLPGAALLIASLLVER